LEIVTGVHQLRIPFPDGAERVTNAWVVEGDQGNILVDCGWDTPEAVWAFREGLKVDGLSFQDISWIVVTHVHPDHLGLADRLRELCGAKVIMHRLDAALVGPRYVDPSRLVEELEAMLLSHGVPPDEIGEMREAAGKSSQFVTPLEPDVLVNEGDTVSNGSFDFEVIHTPGHTPGHICLYEPRKRRLFSGDHVLFDAVPRICADPQSGADPAGDYIQSLESLVDRQVSFVFPGHGPVFNSLGIRSAEILRLCNVRQQQILSELEDGLKTAYDVTRAVPWRVNGGEASYDELPFREKRASVCEAVAWLKRLALDGKVAPLERNGRISYLAK
jgi:glyoxylase-like metal-dependent hydrolase (beta-lactamase superfamily II)